MVMFIGINWFCNWFVSFMFLYLYNVSGVNFGLKIGFIYGGFMVFGVFWVFFLFFEILGCLLEEIDYLFKNYVFGRKFVSKFFYVKLM